METLQLSDIDRRIVAALAQFGRIPYKELAAEVGIPTSTCHGRVRALEERGVIRGYRADISPEAIGQSVSALIMLRVHSHQRDRVPTLTSQLQHIPGVQQVFLIGGDKDLVVHVACESVPALRTLIAEHFGSNSALAQTQTQIVFEHLPGLTPLSDAV
ncbi:Lrp/AsnC family transcriptional regulator [Leucobacter viscericola]|uniref:Lrp/AsnC family transcriptional regulator n=1 Tax=Leucobacter viscericola TaxID=2714935 RepID=A0A6G7XDK1_9MICO|nr:Lrp/AsnC family transcriptional regulator [Leucobacter viscericola]QIK62645.1 Lrp/AsnC family transcriptional regulator [Leucobacter viscericola]